MTYRFLRTLTTPPVRAAQSAFGVAISRGVMEVEPSHVGFTELEPASHANAPGSARARILP